MQAQNFDLHHYLDRIDQLDQEVPQDADVFKLSQTIAPDQLSSVLLNEFKLTQPGKPC